MVFWSDLYHRTYIRIRIRLLNNNNILLWRKYASHKRKKNREEQTWSYKKHLWIISRVHWHRFRQWLITIIRVYLWCKLTTSFSFKFVNCVSQTKEVCLYSDIFCFSSFSVSRSEVYLFETVEYTKKKNIKIHIHIICYYFKRILYNLWKILAIIYKSKINLH